MSIQVRAKFIGAKELESAFDQLPDSMQKQVLLSALKKAAKPVVDDARAKARKRTGKGAKSIKARTNKKLKPIGISIGPSREAFYMMFKEFGTRKEPAEPFLRPAWDSNRFTVLKSMEQEIWKALTKKARTLARKAEKGTLGKRTIEKLNAFSLAA